MQAPRDLPYNGKVKITMSKYYIPSGRCIQQIDYSHRKEDGSVAAIPDSLTSVFYTSKKRPVRDGGGVRPEFEVKERKCYHDVLFGGGYGLVSTSLRIGHKSIRQSLLSRNLRFPMRISKL